jgi:uncharacterized protein YbbC (DUF1343 family)
LQAIRIIHLKIRKVLLILCCWLPIVAWVNPNQTIITGAQQLDIYLPILQGRSVALVVNQTSQVGGEHIVDLLLRQGIHIKRIFAPEHGFRGQAGAGELFNDETNEKNKIEIISLYKVSKRIPPEMLVGADFVVFDLQDVGVRCYTYISTLHEIMEACAANGKPLLLLDRPNPNGHYVDGPVLEKELQSFVGKHPIPVVYGLTMGELAGMINGEGWLEGGKTCDLTVIRLKNYTHHTPYRLPIQPSPNLNTQQAISLYPSLVLFEGTTISVGRGTLSPFQVLGYPDPRWGTFSFVPHAIPDMDKSPKYEGKTCYGLDLSKVEPPSRIDLGYLLHFYKLAKEQGVSFFEKGFDIHAGTKLLRQQIEEGLTENDIRASWQPALAAYKAMRKKYLLYPDK